jgi:SAM-dependent methyltransferase
MTESSGNKKIWDQIYDNSTLRVPYTDVVSYCVKHLTNNPKLKIFEFGCGNGQNIGFLSELFPYTNNYYGFDISETAIYKAKRLYKKIYFFCDKKEFFDQNIKFDIIIERAVVQHISKKNIVEYINKLFTLSKTGGYLFFEIANKGHGLYKCEDEIIDSKTGIRVFYDLKGLKKLFYKFNIIEIRNKSRIIEVSNTNQSGYDESCYQVILQKP